MAIPVAAVPRVSPLRADAIAASDGSTFPTLVPGDPIPTYREPPGAAATAGPNTSEADDEPALPEEARSQAADAAAAPTRPQSAAAGQVLHVRFAGRSTDGLLDAMRAFRDLIRGRPGETRVLVHLEIGGSGALPMELKPVAYDAELLAEVRRRLGDGVELSLA